MPRPLFHLAFSLSILLPSLPCRADPPRSPNLIFILADDLGYGEVNAVRRLHGLPDIAIQTPSLDRMAAEGMILTDFYAGATVCAPSRCVLMTGLHTGRCHVRGNAGRGRPAEIQMLRPQDLTVAELLSRAGYATALFGKWGLGEEHTPGHPQRKGFDTFLGYLNQHHAHNFFTPFLFLGDEKFPLRNTSEDVSPHHPGAGWATPEGRVDYSHTIIVDRSFDWLNTHLATHPDKPFFLYLSLTIPHANNEGTRGTGDGQEIPDHGIYADQDWPAPDKGQAAMITLMDSDVGRILDWLDEHDLSSHTLVIFTSDNGHHKEGGNNPDLFDANGPLRGMKRDLFEGGIRVPTLARWTGTIAPASTSDHPAGFQDLMATAADLASADLPPGLTSLSFLPTLKGQPELQRSHPYLYWEFYEQGSRQAVRFKHWKAIRQPMFTGQIQLYDLSSDLGEKLDVAAEHPDLIDRAAAFMQDAHHPHENWQIP